jgi:hypothetical protein
MQRAPATRRVRRMALPGSAAQMKRACTMHVSVMRVL